MENSQIFGWELNDEDMNLVEHLNESESVYMNDGSCHDGILDLLTDWDMTTLD